MNDHGDVGDIIAKLEKRGTKATRDSYPRYGIVAPLAFGVTVGTLRDMGKEIGRNHDLALELWDTGWYEARLLACFVADPDTMSSSRMDAWTRDFDNWGITDTACFHLFDRSPYQWRKVDLWSRRKDEFVRRAGFALLASLALHDKNASNDEFRQRLDLIEEFANNERNFVKKGVSWALHGIGARNTGLHGPAIALARKLAASANVTERWVGKDALRKLTSPATKKRLARRPAPHGSHRTHR